MDTQKINSSWSDEELEASVDVYLKMLTLEKKGEVFSRSAINRLLREGPLKLRSAGSVEYRMQNISSVFEQLGLDRITGYRPVNNIGAAISERIRESISRIKYLSSLGFESQQAEDQSDSPLYKYLTSNTPEAIKLSEELLLFIDTEDSKTVPQERAKTPPLQANLEVEILELLKREGNITELSREAYKYLSAFLDFFWDKLQKSLNLIAAATLIITYYNSTETLSTSKDIRNTVSYYHPEVRKTLSGNSIITGSSVILREKPNKTSKELGRLGRGVWVENIEGDFSDWIRVRADIGGNEVEGWVYRNYLIIL
ncbi:hypothetical protein ACW9I4_24580 [Pseudomonas sp. SDT2931_S440]